MKLRFQLLWRIQGPYKESSQHGNRYVVQFLHGQFIDILFFNSDITGRTATSAVSLSLGGDWHVAGF